MINMFQLLYDVLLSMCCLSSFRTCLYFPVLLFVCCDCGQLTCKAWSNIRLSRKKEIKLYRLLFLMFPTHSLTNARDKIEGCKRVQGNKSVKKKKCARWELHETDY